MDTKKSTSNNNAPVNGATSGAQSAQSTSNNNSNNSGAPVASAKAVSSTPASINELYHKVAKQLAGGWYNNGDPIERAQQWMHEASDILSMELQGINQALGKGEKFRRNATLDAIFIAEAILKSGRVIAICRQEGKTVPDAVAIKDTNPKSETYGLYVVSDHPQGKESSYLKRIINRFVPAPSQDVKDRVYDYLIEVAPTGRPTQFQGVIPVHNGVFVKRAAEVNKSGLIPAGYKMKDFTFYSWGSPELENMIFIWKLATDYQARPYDPTEPPPTVDDPKWPGGKWSVVDWLRSTHEDRVDPDGLTEFDLAFMASVIDPYYNSGRAAYYKNGNGKGNGGKGTRQQLISNLIGSHLVSSKRIRALRSDFGLSDLIAGQPKIYIVFPEITTSDAIRGMDLWKPLVTGDEIGIDRKFKETLSVHIHASVEMQSNESPIMDDQTDAVWRRMAVVPSSVSFTGCENRAIKAHHIYDKATLEWLLRHCLHEYDFEAKDLEEYITEEMKEELNDYQSEINPVLSFLDTYLGADENGEVKYDITIDTGGSAITGPYYGTWYRDGDNQHKAVRVWGCYPIRYLYAAYCDFAKECGHMRMKRQTFKDNLVRWASHSAYWRWTEETVHRKASFDMELPDSLAAEFGARREELSKLLVFPHSNTKSVYSQCLYYAPKETYRGALLLRDEVVTGKVVGMPKRTAKQDTGATAGADLGAVMAFLEKMTPEARAALMAQFAGQTTVTG